MLKLKENELRNPLPPGGFLMVALPLIVAAMTCVALADKSPHDKPE